MGCRVHSGLGCNLLRICTALFSKEVTLTGSKFADSSFVVASSGNREGCKFQSCFGVSGSTLLSRFCFATISEGTFSENALSAACIAVDALGRSMRTKFVDLFVSDLLEIYRLKFAGSSKLQHVTRRFSWFHRVLRTLEIVLASVFPAHWHVPIEVCIQFCVHTRVSVLAELDAVERSAEIDMTSMLQALHKTRIAQDTG